MLHVLCCSCSALSLINLSEDDLGWTLPATVLLFARGSLVIAWRMRTLELCLLDQEEYSY